MKILKNKNRIFFQLGLVVALTFTFVMNTNAQNFTQNSNSTRIDPLGGQSIPLVQIEKEKDKLKYSGKEAMSKGENEISNTDEIFELDSWKVIYPAGVSPKFVGWDSNGKNLIFFDEGYKLYYTDLEGKFIKMISDKEKNIIDYKMSSDNKYIAYRFNELDGSINLRIMRINYSDKRAENGIIWEKVYENDPYEWRDYIFASNSKVLLGTMYSDLLNKTKLYKISIIPDEIKELPLESLAEYNMFLSGSGNTIVMFDRSNKKFMELKNDESWELLSIPSDAQSVIFAKQGDLLFYIKNRRTDNSKNENELWYYDFSRRALLPESLVISISVDRYPDDLFIRNFKESAADGYVYFIESKGVVDFDTVKSTHSVENTLRRVAMKDKLVSQSLIDIESYERIDDFWISENGKVILYTVYDNGLKNMELRYKAVCADEEKYIQRCEVDSVIWSPAKDNSKAIVKKKNGDYFLIKFYKIISSERGKK